MGFIPNGNEAYINWAVQHGETWKTNASALNIPSAQATAYEADSEKLPGLLLDQAKAIDAARAATADLKLAIMNNRTAAAAMIRAIRATAAASSTPQAIYNLAEIPAPAAPSPLPPPALPTDIKVGIVLATGAVELKWKASNPGSGTAYIVKRILNGDVGPAQFVGVTGGDKSFVDETLPAGVDAVTYQISGQRSGISGPIAEVNVRFGTVEGGARQAFVTTTSPKLAA